MEREAGMTRSATCAVEVVELTDTEGAEMFDRVARREMGISGVDFLARWDAGEWEDVDLDDVPGLVDVWAYLPAVR
jgi:hypothetical protein